MPPILFRVDYQPLLERAMAAAAATTGRGQVADYIPALATVDPDAIDIAMAASAEDVRHLRGTSVNQVDDVEHLLVTAGNTGSLSLG